MSFPALSAFGIITLTSAVSGKAVVVNGTTLTAGAAYSTSVAASATVTLTSAVAAKTVTVNGVVFTSYSIVDHFDGYTGYRNASTNGFRVGVTDAADTIELAAAINACNDPRVAGIVTASPATNVVTITAIALGTSGNAVTLVSNDASMVASNGTLQNGAKNNTFSVAGSDTADAASLAKLINAVCADVYATSAAGVVTVTAEVAGVDGNAIAMSSNDASMVAAAFLTGGSEAYAATDATPGPSGLPLRRITFIHDSYDALITDDIIMTDGATDTHVTLPTTGMVVGQIITVKNIGLAADINVFTGNNDEGGGNPQIWAKLQETFVWTGTAWWIVG